MGGKRKDFSRILGFLVNLTDRKASIQYTTAYDKYARLGGGCSQDLDDLAGLWEPKDMAARLPASAGLGRQGIVSDSSL